MPSQTDAFAFSALALDKIAQQSNFSVLAENALAHQAGQGIGGRLDPQLSALISRALVSIEHSVPTL
jgi:hypothetical protein